MSKKHLLIAILGGTIGGIASIYWRMISYMDVIFVLCSRVIFAAIFALMTVYFQKNFALLKSTFKDRHKIKYIIPAAFIIALNWGLYIWAMGTGRMLDVGLGYFMSPLIVFVVSVLVFKEKSSGLKLTAIFIALSGLLISLAMYKIVPVLGLVLAFSFTVYGILKKHLKLDPAVSICAECLLLSPVAIGVIFFTMRSDLGTLDSIDVLLLVGTGILTVLPLMLYSSAINNLPYIAVGFTQYLAPTITIFVGLFYGEIFTPEKFVLLGFVLISIIVYSFAVMDEGRKLKEVKANVSSNDN